MNKRCVQSPVSPPLTQFLPCAKIVPEMKTLSVSLVVLILTCAAYPVFGSTCMEPLGCARSSAAQSSGSLPNDAGSVQHLAAFANCGQANTGDLAISSFDLLPPSRELLVATQVHFHPFSPRLIDPPPRVPFI